MARIFYYFKIAACVLYLLNSSSIPARPEREAVEGFTPKEVA
jgi:hypothetical protein